MLEFFEFEDNFKRLNERVNRACDSCGRDFSDIKILPVTKNHPAECVKYVERIGLNSVGENRVQEALEKMSELNSNRVNFELIGHLQTNKAKFVPENFSRIQSVDSEKLLLKLNEISPKKKLRILLQINAGYDDCKFGVSPEEADMLFEKALKCDNLIVEGLMTIAPLNEDLDIASKCFENLRNIRDRLSRNFGISLKELSMGMSDDLERAILEGSTMLRVGSFLFGRRI